MSAILQQYQRRAAVGRERFCSTHPHLFIVRKGSADEPEEEPDQFAFKTVVDDDEVLEEPTGWVIVPVRKREGGAFPDRIGLGRARNCDVVLRFPSISKLHAQILVGPPRMLLDLDSANGTKLNGTVLTTRSPLPLAVGDRIELGGIEMLLLDADRLFTLLTG